MNRYIVADVDGTITLDDHRHHLVQKEDPPLWEDYFAACVKDEPNWPVIFLLHSMRHYNIILITGRPETIRKETEQWMMKFAVPYHELLMRPDQLSPEDHTWKVEALREHIPGHRPKDIIFVLEDRTPVVDAWREEGYTCFQVQPSHY